MFNHVGISDEDINKVYSRNDILVFRLYEGFGMPIIEAIMLVSQL